MTALIWFRRFVAASMLSAYAVSGSAALMAEDRSVSGDAQLTLDTATGFKWLDLTASAGLGDVSGRFGAGQAFSGFRYATASEVQTLLADAGLPFGTLNSTAAVGAAEALFALLGALESNTFSFDIFNTSNGQIETHSLTTHSSFAVAGDSPSFLGSKITTGWLTEAEGIRCALGLPCYFLKASSRNNLGGDASWLVQTAVSGPPTIPEPSTYALVGAGLLVMGLRARRRVMRQSGA